MPRHVHLDASIIVPLLGSSDPDNEQNSRNIIGTLTSQTNRHDIGVKITQLAVGETVAQYLENLRAGEIPPGYELPNYSLLNDLNAILDRINGELIGIGTDCQSVAVELQQRDRNVCNNDALIAAQAIVDPNSTHLLTTDGPLINTPAIPSVCDNRHRNHNLTVTDTY